MIIVNTNIKTLVTQNFNKNSCGELIHHKIPQKSSQIFKTARIHYFINQHTYLNISPTNPQKRATP